jgi:hypothetical protein
MGAQGTADRCSRWRAISEVEASIVLGALDGLTDNKPVCEVRVSMGADSIRGTQFSGFITVEGIG